MGKKGPGQNNPEKEEHRSLISIFSSKIAKKFCDWINEYSLIQSQKFEFCIFSANFWWIFFRISRQIPENSDVCRFFNQICEIKSEICRKFWILWKKFTIIGELFTSLLRRGSPSAATLPAAPSRRPSHCLRGTRRFRLSCSCSSTRSPPRRTGCWWRTRCY